MPNHFSPLSPSRAPSSVKIAGTRPDRPTPTGAPESSPSPDAGTRPDRPTPPHTPQSAPPTAAPEPTPSPALFCLGQRAHADPLYCHYHDTEWGRPVTEENALFERLCLEIFEVGLSWLTILRRREVFRECFAGFDIPTVARFGAATQERLAQDARMIRNRAKIQACVDAAGVVETLHERGQTLGALIWSHRPSHHARPGPDHPRAAQTPQSEALAKELRALGVRFVGPVNQHATMQAAGVINDHVVGCPVGDEIDLLARS